MEKLYKLINSNGEFYYSKTKGIYGGYNGKEKIYGRLDCPSALKWIQKGFYVEHRVFFASEYDAVLAGFRPCAICQKEKYKLWKLNPEKYKENIIKNHLLNNENNLTF